MPDDLNTKPGCLGALLALLMGHREPPQALTFPYRVRDDFLSPAERSFLGVLHAACSSRFAVYPKVRLADVFFVSRPHENRPAFNHIAQKHIDFLLCEPSRMTPVLGVELDDASHSRADRAERDAFVEQVFLAARLPLLRVPVSASYTPVSVAAQIESLLNPASTPSVMASVMVPVSVASDANPVCPKCGIPMVLRRASRGQNSGEEFYGCSNYPRCRATIFPGRIPPAVS